MATCLMFLRVPDIAQTITWYERIGFKCLGKNQEPGRDLDWPLLDWEGASFMLYLDERKNASHEKDAGHYFKMTSIEGLLERLEGKAKIIEVTEKTFYGRKEIVFEMVSR